MVFPHIDPTWSKKMVYELAEAYFLQIKHLQPTAVHLMGELTFCFILATLLEREGISCVASTTERMVEEVDAKKISRFTFVQFRPYF